MDPALEHKRPKGKKRRRQDIITNHLRLYAQLKQRDLQGVLLDAAVWVCAEDDILHTLDCLCLGNLDGGTGTADHIADILQRSGKSVPGKKAVRLSLDEAFFMAYALGILAVHDVVDERACLLDVDTLWRRLLVARVDFLTLYLGYHHFRSKGWIARTGLQYGADFVLYQRHPALAHSDYSVIILPFQEGHDGLMRPRMSWHDVQVANRLTTQVGKRLLLLHVHQKTPCDCSSPKCLSTFTSHERLIRRWVPESHRPVS